MRLISLLLIVTVLLISQPCNAAGWRRIFSDDFNSQVFEKDKWVTRFIYNNGQQDTLNDEREQYRDNNNHEFKDGALWLVARHVRNVNERFPFESGMIRSRQLIKYGYVEARVNLPAIRGIWPAFWLNSDYDANGKLEWPPEIDIFEYVVNGVTEHPNMIHSNAIPRIEKPGRPEWLFSDENFNRRWTYLDVKQPINNRWIKVAIVWTPIALHWYFNDKKIYSKSYEWVRRDGSSAPPAHILFNLAVGGNWAGRGGIDTGSFPVRFGIDYVFACAYNEPGSGDDCDGRKVPPADEFSAEFAMSGAK